MSFLKKKLVPTVKAVRADLHRLLILSLKATSSLFSASLIAESFSTNLRFLLGSGEMKNEYTETPYLPFLFFDIFFSLF